MLKMRNAHVKLVAHDIESRLNGIVLQLNANVVSEREYQVVRRPLGPLCYLFIYQDRTWFMRQKISVSIMIDGPANFIKVSIRNGEHHDFFKNNLTKALEHLTGVWEISYNG